MSQRDLARAGNGASADQASIADGVVGRTEGTSADQSRAIFKGAGDAVNAGGLDGFVEGHWREDRGNALGEHGFPGSRGADEQDVVTARASDFEGTLGGLLAVHVAHIDGVPSGFTQNLVRIDVNGLEGFRRVHEIDGLRKRFQGKDFDAVDNSGLAGVVFGHGDGLEPLFASGDGRGKRAAHRAHAAIQGQLAEKHHLVQGLAKELALAANDAEGHG